MLDSLQLDHLDQIGDRPVLFLTAAVLGLLIFMTVYAILLRREGLKLLAAPLTLPFGLLFGLLLARGIYVAFNWRQTFDGVGIAGLLSSNPEEYSLFGLLAGFLIGARMAARVSGIKKTDNALDCLAVPFSILTVFLFSGLLFLGYYGFAEQPFMGFLSIPSIAPLVLVNQWQEAWIAICMMEAVSAIAATVVCGIRGSVRRLPGLLFEETIFALCAIHLFWAIQYQSIYKFYFVCVDQVLCAVTMLLLMIGACGLHRNVRKRWPVRSLLVFILGIVINGVAQFFMDKTERFVNLLPQGIGNWISEDVSHTGMITFALLAISVILMVACYFRLMGRVRQRMKE